MFCRMFVALFQMRRWKRRQTTVVIRTVTRDPGASRLTAARHGITVMSTIAVVSTYLLCVVSSVILITPVKQNKQDNRLRWDKQGRLMV